MTDTLMKPELRRCFLGVAWGVSALLLTLPGQSAPPAPFVLAHPDLESYQQKIPASFEGYYGELYRPQFHYTSYINWTSDPNGLAYYDGTYHLFYQHNPMGRWATVPFWGHAVSTDLVHWRQEPCVFPSTPRRLGRTSRRTTGV